MNQFDCQYCDKIFSSISNVKRHIKLSCKVKREKIEMEVENLRDDNKNMRNCIKITVDYFKTNEIREQIEIKIMKEINEESSENLNDLKNDYVKITKILKIIDELLLTKILEIDGIDKKI